jgi:pilus assembly protein CpaE
LSAVCDAGTKVILIGAVNDVALYRDLMDNGVSDYLVAPVSTNDLTATILRLFHTAGKAQPGKVCAFIGASGGTGSSTIAQNVAGTIAGQFGVAVMLADLDLQFGSVALNLNLESAAGFAEQLSDPARLDDALLDRLLVTRGKNLNVLSGVASVLNLAEPGLPALEKLIDLAQASFPFVILDLQHGWSPWVSRALTLADEVVLTVKPDLGNLRNARMMLNTLAQLRPNDPATHLVLNQIGVPKRAEIKPAAILKALQVTGMTEIGFDTAAFSRAANSGLLLAESSPKAAACRAFGQLAAKLGGARHAIRQPTGLSRLWRRP